MKIKRSGWVPWGPEADSAIRILTGNAARLFAYIYARANRQNGRLEIRYQDVSDWLGGSTSIADDFTELRDKGVCRTLSAANQNMPIQIEICNDFWPYEKANVACGSDVSEYVSKIRSFLQARACVKCDFGAADQKFASDLYARGVKINQIERAISLGCARKYTSLLNETDKDLISRLAYFRELIEEAADLDAGYWERSVNLQLEKLEKKWRQVQDADSHYSPSAGSLHKKQTG